MDSSVQIYIVRIICLKVVYYKQKLQHIQMNPNEQKKVPSQSKKQDFIDRLFQKKFNIQIDSRSFLFIIIGFGVLFLVLSIITLALALRVKTIQLQYANERKCINSNLQADQCSVKFTISQQITAPIYMMYVVKNIYINHRKFLNSYSNDQMKGKVLSSAQAEKQCAPFAYNKDIFYNKSWSGNPLDPNSIASPCGFKPQGFFNDTYKLYREGQRVSIDRKGVFYGKAVDSHRGPNSQKNQWIDVENQHFKLYMDDGSLMTKKRVWGVIRNDLKPGNYELLIKNRFQMANLRIVKGVYLTTATVMGGKQLFYPVAFGICFLACFIFAIVVKKKLPSLKKKNQSAQNLQNKK